MRRQGPLQRPTTRARPHRNRSPQRPHERIPARSSTVENDRVRRRRNGRTPLSRHRRRADFDGERPARQVRIRRFHSQRRAADRPRPRVRARGPARRALFHTFHPPRSVRQPSVAKRPGGEHLFADLSGVGRDWPGRIRERPGRVGGPSGGNSADPFGAKRRPGSGNLLALSPRQSHVPRVFRRGPPIAANAPRTW